MRGMPRGVGGISCFQLEAGLNSIFCGGVIGVLSVLVSDRDASCVGSGASQFRVLAEKPCTGGYGLQARRGNFVLRTRADWW